ncbi:hypothetical protein BD779DRAFT_1476945 [Infundibulicybe gibba]|nr:hypothetical protein BD779DRAFT_1476945 [Infundibulicybe gibba]
MCGFLLYYASAVLCACNKEWAYDGACIIALSMIYKVRMAAVLCGQVGNAQKRVNKIESYERNRRDGLIAKYWLPLTKPLLVGVFVSPCRLRVWRGIFAGTISDSGYGTLAGGPSVRMSIGCDSVGGAEEQVNKDQRDTMEYTRRGCYEESSREMWSR